MSSEATTRLTLTASSPLTDKPVLPQQLCLLILIQTVGEKVTTSISNLLLSAANEQRHAM